MRQGLTRLMACGVQGICARSGMMQGESTTKEQRAMAEDQEPTTNLIHLGEGVGSKVERIKKDSNYLHGQITEQLQQDTARFTEDQVQLLKFHGTYQQEDRDQRSARRTAGAEKAYQFMI